MIPLRDMNPTVRRPIITWLLIATNVAVFVYEFLLGPQGMQDLVQRFGMIPGVLTGGDLTVPRSAGGGLGALITPFSSMFLHGSWMHLIGNMWFLHVFGDNIEDALGQVRFVLFYLVCGFMAAAGQAAIDPSSMTPMVGASGAISGVLAGYVLLYPRARVVTLVPIFIFIQFVELPAFLFIFVWFGIQLFMGATSLGADSGVAWFAHIGGFVAGLLVVRWLVPRQQMRRAAAHRFEERWD